MDRVTFGRRLKELRQQAGLTQTELAERAGRAASSIRNIEQGLVGASWLMVEVFCAALNISREAFDQVPAGKLPYRLSRPKKKRKGE